MLNKFLTIFILLFLNSAFAEVKVCFDEVILSLSPSSDGYIQKVKDCAEKNKGEISLGFRDAQKSIFLLDEEINNSVFYFSFPMMHNVDFYHFLDGKLEGKKNYSKTKNQGNEYVSINAINDKSNTIVAITDTKNSTQIPFITFDSIEKYSKFIKSKHIFDGLWFGILVLASFITLLIFGIRRHKEIFFYFLHITSLMLIQMAFSGYFFSYFSFLPEYFKHRVVVLACGFLTVGTVGLIYFNFKGQGKESLVLKVYKSVIYIGIAHFIFSLVHYGQLTIKLTSYLTLLLSLTTLAVSIYALVKKYKNSGIFLLSFSLFLFSSLAFTMKDLGILNINEIYMNYTVKISLLVEILLLGVVIVRSLVEENKVLSEAHINKEISENAKRIHHDIKSPLSSLEFLLDDIKNDLSEDHRIIGKESLNRISDIINTLEQSKIASQSDTQILYPLVAKVISEKRMEFKHQQNVEIDLLNNLDYGVFTNFSKVILSRAISNMINNSIEAKKEDQNLKVSVELKNSDTDCSIVIKDNGIGIKKENLENILTYGVSLNKKDGKGIGLSSAKMEIEKLGGNFSIDSEYNQGTTITVTIPQANSPKWFEKSLNIAQEKVCIIDDDDSIHSVWEKILKDSGKSLNHVRSSKEFDTFSKNNDLKEFYFLFDLELLRSKENGLDLIKKYNLSERSSLVTSHYDDKEVQKLAVESDVKIIPKESARYIEINSSTTEIETKEIVLIDDDSFTHKTWRLVAKNHGHKISCYFSVADFLKEAEFFKKEIEIYVDRNLGNDKLGDLEAEKIFNLGFENIVLATGSRLKELPRWIKSQQSKDYPI